MNDEVDDVRRAVQDLLKESARLERQRLKRTALAKLLKSPWVTCRRCGGDVWLSERRIGPRAVYRCPECDACWSHGDSRRVQWVDFPTRLRVRRTDG